MRFSRKSPAVASMERHRPEADWIDAEEKARVAESSHGFASAAAEGLRTLPARETATTVGEVAAVLAAIPAGGAVVRGSVVSTTDAVELAAGSEAVGVAGATLGTAATSSPNVKD